MKALLKNIMITVILVLPLFGQAPDTLWTKVYGGTGNDWGYSIQPTSDGGYIIVGFTDSFGAGNTDIWLLKVNSNGDTVWTKTFGGAEEDEGWCVLETTDGGYIISGHTKSFGPGEEDLWLIKTNITGDTVWTKIYGGLDDDKYFILRQTLGQGYIILGQTRSIGAGFDDLWVLKTDVDGDTIWTKTYGDSLDNNVGSIELTMDGGYIITGTTELNSSGEQDIWLIKINEYGDTLWTKKIGGYSSERITPNSVQQTSDGGYIIFASSESYGSGGEDVWLIKTDENGDTLWTRSYGGSQDDVSICGHQTSDDGYILLARTSSYGAGQIDIWLIRTDSIGNVLWTKTLGGLLYDIGVTLQSTNEGGYIIAGATASFASNGIDLWLICLEPDSTTYIGGALSILEYYRLYQNFPNPFNPTTTIKFLIPELSFITLKVYDVLGIEIIALVNEEKSAGSYEIEFNASALSSGVYFYRLQAGDFVETKKMVLLR